MLSGSIIGLRKDETRIQGLDIKWTLPQVEKRSQIYLIVPITMLVFAMTGSILTYRLEKQPKMDLSLQRPDIFEQILEHHFGLSAFTCR